MKRRLGRTIAAAGLVLCLAGQDARAEHSETGSAGDDRDALVTELIERNQRLRELYGVNPALTRAIALRLLEHAAQDDTGRTAAADEGGNAGTDNPDIDALERSSPQAVLDLIELLKLVSETVEPTQGNGVEGDDAHDTGGGDAGDRSVQRTGGGEPD